MTIWGYGFDGTCQSRGSGADCLLQFWCANTQVLSQYSLRLWGVAGLEALSRSNNAITRKRKFAVLSMPVGATSPSQMRKCVNLLTRWSKLCGIGKTTRHVPRMVSVSQKLFTILCDNQEWRIHSRTSQWLCQVGERTLSGFDTCHPGKIIISSLAQISMTLYISITWCCAWEYNR